MNVTLTGGTGFLGGCLLRLLRNEGITPRALIRRSSQAADMRAAGADPILGDLNAAATLTDFVRPNDIVIHSAARVDLVGTSDDYRRGTVDTTRHLLDAALPRRPARFVHISSAAVYSERDVATGACADRHVADPPPYNHYGRAKLAAERLVRRMCRRAGCPWTILRIGFLYGPHNRTLHEQFTRFSDGRRVQLIGPGHNRIAALYIDDAVRAIWRAATHPVAAGRIYDVANSEPVTQERFVNDHLRALRLPEAERLFGRRTAYLGAWLAELGARIAGEPNEISRAMVCLMAVDQAIDSSAIQRETGWCPLVGFDEGIQHVRTSLNSPQS
ncbi:MAG: NAD-dependent epimerase/dehydratase family protein [Phycisphaerae bacterium]|nr:NAD-dependent epimerase/dehydratase family protein [Phycisphaerae bacterium]